MARFSRWQDLILPVSLITSILVILVPLPPYLMDVLLAANITISVSYTHLTLPTNREV